MEKMQRSRMRTEISLRGELAVKKKIKEKDKETCCEKLQKSNNRKKEKIPFFPFKERNVFRKNPCGK